MNDKLFVTSSGYLWEQPERRKKFKAIRKEVESSIGNRTNTLAFTLSNDTPAEVCIDPPILSPNLNNSHYSVEIGLESYKLKYGKNTIGRSSKSDITIDNPYISRNHFLIIVHSNGHAELFDTASMNKTYVNDVEVSRCWLSNGDVIKLCNLTMIVSLNKI